MKSRDYRDYLNDIMESIEDISEFTGDMSREEFIKDKKTYNAVVRCIEVIGEASKKIPDEIKQKEAGIPWKFMAGMRDKLIHEYFGIDGMILWKTIKEDIHPLRDKIKKLSDSL
ncbi:MAG: DUF86 domain-containing protein [Spirochaetes bacterium]|jgi:uncharacterized protein with HEPN domain|nr:DUF86 domain-containing protein [Spirochaetota bacterium]